MQAYKVIITHTDGSTETMYRAADSADKAEAAVRQYVIDLTGAPPTRIDVLERLTFSRTGAA